MKIYYEDENIIVLEKPYGVSSQESSGQSVLSLLRGEGKEAFCVHRLDTQTTGVMVYAKNKEAAARLSLDIANGNFYKEYLAVCHENPGEYGEMNDILFHDKLKNKSFVIDKKRAGAKVAKLEFWTQGGTIFKEKQLSLVKIRLHTGRTHQIRAQFASRGFFLYGDGKYGAKDNDKIALHCHKIKFNHPKTGKSCEFFSLPSGEVWDSLNQAAEQNIK